MKTSHLISYSAAFALAVASVILSVLLFSGLPNQIPVHFGFSGNPDSWASKEIVTIFMIPALELLFFFLFLLIYRHPQYMSWPTTMLLMTVEAEKREKVFDVLRSMLAALLFAISVLFTYLQFAIFATANNRLPGLNQYFMIATVTFLFGVIIYHNVRIFGVVRKLTKSK